MDLIDLLNQVRKVVGHNNVTWETDGNGGIIFHMGLTCWDKDGRVMSSDRGLELRLSDSTVALTEMENG